VHIVFRVFQTTRASADAASKSAKHSFRVEISLSHGDSSNSTSAIAAHHASVGECLPVEPLVLLASSCRLADVISWFGDSEDESAVAPLASLESRDLSPDTPKQLGRQRNALQRALSPESLSYDDSEAV
jgi:hypothetical protein